MFFRLLMESFRRQRRRKMLAGVAILLGTTAVTAMLALATTIGDRIHKELVVVGANLAKRFGLKVGDGIRMQGAPNSAGPVSAVGDVVGIVTTGDETDNEMLLPLQVAQGFAGAKGGVRRVEVSARTKPEDAF